MSNVPLPPIYENHAGKWIDVEDARAYAAAVSAADNAALCERVRVLECALQFYARGSVARAALEK